MLTRLLHGIIGAMIGAFSTLGVSHYLYGSEVPMAHVLSAAGMLGVLGLFFGHAFLASFKNVARLRM